MRRSTVLSLPPQLLFPAATIMACLKNTPLGLCHSAVIDSVNKFYDQKNLDDHERFFVRPLALNPLTLSIAGAFGLGLGAVGGSLHGHVACFFFCWSFDRRFFGCGLNCTAQCYKTFYVRNLRTFVKSYCLSPESHSILV
jgi:hypothetical protein